jgi:hypothetical protein
MGVAFRRASEARAELIRTPRNKHVDAVAKLLFGDDTAKADDVACG